MLLPVLPSTHSNVSTFLCAEYARGGICVSSRYPKSRIFVTSSSTFVRKFLILHNRYPCLSCVNIYIYIYIYSLSCTRVHVESNLNRSLRQVQKWSHMHGRQFQLIRIENFAIRSWWYGLSTVWIETLKKRERLFKELTNCVLINFITIVRRIATVICSSKQRTRFQFIFSFVSRNL